MKDSGFLFLLLIGGGVAYYLYTQSQVQNQPSTAVLNASTAAVLASIPVNQGGTGAAVAPVVGSLAPAPTLPTDPASLSGLGSVEYDWPRLCV